MLIYNKIFSKCFICASPFDFHVFGVDDPRVGVRRDDLLPERLRAPADEEEAAGDAVDHLPQGVDAADAAHGRVASDAPLDGDPRIAPAEQPHRIAHGVRVAGPDDDGVAQRRADFGFGGRHGLCGGLQPADFEPQPADLFGVGRTQGFELPAPQPQDLRRGGLLPGLRAVVRDLGGESGLVLDEAPVFGAVAAVGTYEQRRHGDGVEHEVFFHGFRDLVARKVRRKGPVRFLFFRKQPLHDEGDALGDERHQRLPVAACEGGDAPVVGEEEFVDPRQLPASEGLLAQLQPRGPYGPHGQFPFDALRAGGRQHRVSRDGEQRGVVGFAEDSLPVATHGDIGSRALRHTAGQLRRRFAGRGRGLGERQVVAERHGLGLEAPEGVAVVERHPRGCETLLAVGPQFDAHESRHPRRIAFRGGEGLDAGREACGCISPAEQLARCGVEPCGVRLRIAGAAPGEVDRLI